MRTVVAVVALVACGRVDFDPHGWADSGGSAVLTYRDAVLADRPLSYWRLDDTDTVVRDVMQQTEGTYAGACARGRPGLLVMDSNPAVQLDGTCRIEVGDRYGFAGQTAYTIEAWAYSQSTAPFQHVFTKQTRAGGPVDGYAVVYETQLQLKHERAVGTQTFETVPFAVEAGAVVHVAAVYDGANLVLYVNGASSIVTLDVRPLPPLAVPAIIGASLSGNNGFVGVLDEVAVYDRALPVDRIRLHHEIGRTGPRGL